MAGNPARLIDEADRAVARGNLTEARRLLETALSVPEGPADVETCLKLAALCRGGGDLGGAKAAVEAALAVDPLHFVALLLRASLSEQGGEDAGEAFGRALAQRPAGVLPAQLAGIVAHAEARRAAFQQDAEHRFERVATRAAPHASPDVRARIARFGRNALRLARPYHSEPTHYHYPGLVEREFHERGDFSWLERLEARTDTIAEDFERVARAAHAEILPYVQYDDAEPVRQWKTLNRSRDWSAIHLVHNGQRVEANARHCEATMALLAALPQPSIPGLSPNAMFSLLAPGTTIPPHTGIANTRLVCHLPLVVPDGCWFRVGAERRTWRRGEAWVFDDTIEHEAANGSDALRVVLIFDIWHPGLSASERKAVAALVADHDQRINAA